MEIINIIVISMVCGIVEENIDKSLLILGITES